MKNAIHIGNLIREKLKENERTVVWFAKQIGCERTKAHRILNSKDLYTDTLFEISIAMKYDFFADYSKLLSQYLS